MKTEDLDIYTQSEWPHGGMHERVEYLFCTHLPTGITVKLPVSDDCRKVALEMIRHGIKVYGWRDEP